MFDDHDDFITPKSNTIKNLIRFLQKPSKEELNTIVEFDLKTLDDDWVKVGMELGIAGNTNLLRYPKLAAALAVHSEDLYYFAHSDRRSG